MAGNATIELSKLTLHRIVDLDPFAIPVEAIFPGASLAQLDPAARGILADRHVDFAAGKILLVIQSHLLRFGGKTILLDACVGEHKSRPLRPDWNNRASTAYLANLAAAGCAPEDIDIVMCTHLHADHVGWNTRLQSGRWVPTFPNARYVMTQREIDQRAEDAAKSPQANHGSYQDSVLPVLDAGLAKIAKPGDALVDGATLLDLAGHSPGQIGLELAAGDGAHFIFCGDAIHSPVQVFQPGWSSGFCFDRAHAVRTRRMLLERAASEDLRLIPAHLRGTGMRITEKSGAFAPQIEA
jgi:glyoxylase-like metal-dependent hydrolase (beta-lactamase superfamily II)